MGRYQINKTFIVENTRKVFIVGLPFQKDLIDVFLDGVLQVLGKDYITNADSGTIIFQKELSNNSTVSIRTTPNVSNMSIEVMSYGKKESNKSLFQRYSSVEKLKYNNEYKMNICINKEMIQSTFSTKLTPCFMTTRKIWEDIGEFIDGYTEKYIISLLHQNSQEVIDMIDGLEDDNSDTTSAEKYTKDSSGVYTTTNKNVLKWVRYKTDIDLILARYYGISARYGSFTKSMGDIEITKSTKLPYIDQLLKRLEDKLNAAEKGIKGTSIAVSSFVKGQSTSTYTERTIRF